MNFNLYKEKQAIAWKLDERLRRKVLPLYMAPEGSIVRVVRILGVRGPVRRLYEFGILPGTILLSHHYITKLENRSACNKCPLRDSC